MKHGLAKMSKYSVEGRHCFLRWKTEGKIQNIEQRMKTVIDTWTEPNFSECSSLVHNFLLIFTWNGDEIISPSRLLAFQCRKQRLPSALYLDILARPGSKLQTSSGGNCYNFIEKEYRDRIPHCIFIRQHSAE